MKGLVIVLKNPISNTLHCVESLDHLFLLLGCTADWRCSGSGLSLDKPNIDRAEQCRVDWMPRSPHCTCHIVTQSHIVTPSHSLSHTVPHSVTQPHKVSPSHSHSNSHSHTVSHSHKAIVTATQCRVTQLHRVTQSLSLSVHRA